MSLSSAQQLLLSDYGVREHLGVVVDSAMPRDEALGDEVVPEGWRTIHALIRPHLAVVGVVYRGYDRAVHIGQIVVHTDLVKDTQTLFRQMFRLNFPIYSVNPHSTFDYDDERAMRANNSSNYRPEPESEHRKGSAFDINPLVNPFDRLDEHGNRLINPAGAMYHPTAVGALTMEHPVRRFWATLDYEWGGNWGNPNADPPTDFFKANFYDYQHFQLNDRRRAAFNAGLPAGL